MKYTIKNIKESQDYSKVYSLFLFKYIFIPLAWPLTWFFANLGASPNHVTLLRMLLVLISFVLILIEVNLYGFIMLYICLILDCSDGQIARLTNKATHFGKFFDGWIDSFFDITFPIIIAIYSYKQSNYDQVLIIGLSAGLFNALYWIIISRFTIFKSLFKKHNFSPFLEKIFIYTQNKLLLDWFDIKYSFFPIFLILGYINQYLILILIVNISFFIWYTAERIYKAYYLLNIPKKSFSHKESKK